MIAEDLVRALVDQVWNGGDVDRLERFYAASFDHGGRPDSPDGLRRWHAAESATWTDTRYEIVSLVSDGVQVAVRWRATARQTGQWGPVPPTGRTISWDGMHFFEVRGDRIVAMWAMADVVTKAQQLGATLTPPPTGDQ